jgi:hypothetical protein
MNAEFPRDELVSGLVRSGERLISGGGREQTGAYFSPTHTFHGRPG